MGWITHRGWAIGLACVLSLSWASPSLGGPWDWIKETRSKVEATIEETPGPKESLPKILDPKLTLSVQAGSPDGFTFGAGLSPLRLGQFRALELGFNLGYREIGVYAVPISGNLGWVLDQLGVHMFDRLYLGPRIGFSGKHWEPSYGVYVGTYF